MGLTYIFEFGASMADNLAISNTVASTSGRQITWMVSMKLFEETLGYPGTKTDGSKTI